MDSDAHDILVRPMELDAQDIDVPDNDSFKNNILVPLVESQRILTTNSSKYSPQHEDCSRTSMKGSESSS